MFHRLAIRRFGLVLLTTLALNFIALQAAHAATYYVAINGSDSAAGTEAAPWKTIEYAVRKMQAGDTTYVKGGVYSDPPRFSRSGTESAPIKLLNAPGESPVIDCGRVATSLAFQKGKYEEHLPIGHITLEGFEIRNCHNGMWLSNGHDIIIRRNWIHDNAAQGILGNGVNMLVDRNIISHNGNFPACAADKVHCNQMHGMYVTGTNWIITNNLIYDNLANGIVVAGYEHCPQGGCWGGYSGAKPKIWAGSEYGGASGWLIANNTIAYQHYREAIVVWQRDATNNKIINNIFYENSQKHPSGVNGISFYGSGGGHTVQNNIFYATGSGATRDIEVVAGNKVLDKSLHDKYYTQSGNIVNTVNLGFEGAGATISGVPNFKLKAGSPAIDKGANLLPTVTWDHQGIKRPAGAAFEIGAYEFCPPSVVCEQGSPPPNPVGDGVPPAVPRPPSTYDPDGRLCPR